MQSMNSAGKGRNAPASPTPKNDDAILAAVHAAMDKASSLVQVQAPSSEARRPTLMNRIGLGGRKTVADAEAKISKTRIDPAADEKKKALESLFGNEAPTKPTAAAPTPRPLVARPIVATKKKLDRGDITLAALGITLGLICALFPWYIFFNQEQFGVREFVFEGGRPGTPGRQVAYQPRSVGKPFSTGEVPTMELDFFPTATLPNEDEQARAIPASQQPFPLDVVNYRLVHVANGRAMIEDDDGLWVVQPGSRLPDASRVVSIERRDGTWVMVNSQNVVIPLEN